MYFNFLLAMLSLANAFADEAASPAALPAQMNAVEQTVDSTLNPPAKPCDPPPAAPACADSLVNYQAVTIQTTLFPATGMGCAIMVSPVSNSMPLRRLVFSQRGGVEFEDDVGQKSGAQQFFFFPRKQLPSYQTTPNGLNVTTPSGATIFVDTQKYQTPNSPTLKPDGVWNAHTLILDSGYAWGNAANANPARSSTFEDPFKHTCSVLNSEIFTYAKNKWDPDFKFETDQDLWAFLGKRCPLLKLPQL